MNNSLVVSAFASNVVIPKWSQAEHLVSTAAGEGTLAGRALDWESVSGCFAGFPRTLGILFDSSVFHLVGCGERSSLSLLPLVSDVKWVEDVPCTCTVPSTE